MAPSLNNILHRENKIKTKQNVIVGWTTGTMTTGQQCLVPRVMAGVIGLIQALQDDVHRLQDVADLAWILGDLRD
jgi:hypothetical protein